MFRFTRRRLMRTAAGALAMGVIPSTVRPSMALAAPAARPASAPGAILGTHRLVTYYGNPYSGAMGILGQLSQSDLVAAIQQRASQYADAGGKPTRGAIHMVVTTAQASPGADGLYVARMPQSVIREYADLAAANGLLFIADVQVGRSTVPAEVAAIMPILELPQAHLALDPEFDMWGPQVPGQQIGHMTAGEINHAIGVMADIASRSGQQKMLVIHQFMASMLPDKAAIGGDPRVDLAIVMDGYGGQSVKIDHYNAYVRNSDFPYGGIKLFFDWDPGLMTPAEALSLTPPPDIIIYQ